MSSPEETWSGREWLIPRYEYDGVNAADDVKSGARSTERCTRPRPQQVDIVMLQSKVAVRYIMWM